MPVPLYSIHDLCVSKGKEDILLIKQFDIHRGACYVFEGSMGSGKTAFINVLSERCKIKRGKVEFEQKNLYNYSRKEYQDFISIVPSPSFRKESNLRRD